MLKQAILTKVSPQKCGWTLCAFFIIVGVTNPVSSSAQLVELIASYTPAPVPASNSAPAAIREDLVFVGVGTQEGSRLMRTTDRGKTWDTVLVVGYTAVINSLKFKDSLNGAVELTSGGASRYYFITSDGGKTWQPGLKVNYLKKPQMFVTRCGDTLICYQQFLIDHGQYDSSVIVHNAGGLGFSLLPNGENPWFLTGTIDGDGGVIYTHARSEHGDGSLTRKDGLWQSKDDGNTWKYFSAGAGWNSEFPSFSVTGQGRTVYFTSRGSLYRFTDTTIDPSISRLISFRGIDSSLFLDSLSVDLCDTTHLDLSVGYHACDGFRFSKVTADSSLVGVKVYASTARITDGKNGSISLGIYPRSEGVFTVPIRLELLLDDWSKQDTTLNLTVTVKASPAVLSVSPDTLDFGTVPLCDASPRQKSFLLSNIGCAALPIDSAWLLAGTSEFSFSPLSNLTLVRSESARKVDVSFLAKSSGASFGRIVIAHGGIFDTIILRGRGSDDTKQSASWQIDTIRSTLCDSANAVIELGNLSCSSMEINSLMIPPSGLSFSPALTFPVVVGAGESVSLPVRFVPTIVGSQQLSIPSNITFILNGVRTTVDTTFSLNIQSSSGAAVASLSRSMLDFGDVSTCGDSVMSFVVYSVGCDTLRVSGANATGDFSGSIGASSFTDSAVYTVRFAPSKEGSVSQRLVIQTNAGPVEILLQGRGVGSSAATLSSTSISLEASANCTTASDSVYFSNIGCGEITLDSVRSSDRLITLSSSNGILAEGSRRTIGFNFAPTTEGTSDALVTIYYHGASGEMLSKQLQVHLVSLGSPTVNLSIGAVTSSAEVGSVVVIPIMIDAIGKLASGRELDLSVAMNTDLLSPKVVTASSGWVVKSWSSNGGGVVMKLSSASDFTGKAEAAKITCAAFITDTVRTPISIGAASSRGDCLTLQSSGESNFTLLPNCGDEILVDALGKKLPFDVRSVHPNPASTALTVELLRATKSAVRYELSDMRGTVISHGILLGNIDVSRLSAGEYHLRISADGFVQTRKVVIER